MKNYFIFAHEGGPLTFKDSYSPELIQIQVGPTKAYFEKDKLIKDLKEFIGHMENNVKRNKA